MAKIIFPNPAQMIMSQGHRFLGPEAELIKQIKWQGMSITSPMVEIFDTVLRVQIPEDKMDLLDHCKPDMPWAEDHFQERISGVPSNPGNTYTYWTYYQEKEYRAGGKFTHTYMERFWPKFAGVNYKELGTKGNEGIRYPYGDFLDVIKHLIENPSSRQAYLPIWFPEDTGVLHGGRVPCTLGYLFNIRKGYLHCSYYLRSCDYTRHFKNDVFLAGRLMQHIASVLKDHGIEIKMGQLKMDIESFHIFQSDLYEIKKRLK